MEQQATTGDAPRGAGVLVQTEVERIDLGVHAGHHLQAHVQHRTLRLAVGRWWSGSLTLGRRHPTHIEVRSEVECDQSDPRSAARTDQTPYDVAIAHPTDPWPRYVRRVILVAGSCWMMLTIVRRIWRNEGDQR